MSSPANNDDADTGQHDQCHQEIPKLNKQRYGSQGKHGKIFDIFSSRIAMEDSMRLLGNALCCNLKETIACRGNG